MKATAGVFALALFVTASTAASSQAQFTPSRCADCHFANPRSVSRWHLSEWDHSAHGRANVGCEKCHGGDPTTFESFLAHQGMLSPPNPASPVNRVNLPKTCGGCHPGPFAAFQKSKHYELLREGNLDTPTCTTCHGNVGAYLLSPKALYAECSSCHAAGKVAPRGDFPAEGRIRLAAIREVRASLDEAKTMIQRIKDKDRRARLEAELNDAQAPLLEAVHAAHMFVFDQMEDRLGMARKRAEMLMEQLANPTSPSGK
jgi:Cytochrome c7 and related cytochrome c/Cytochrome c554 and c-prime